ncbi:glycosyltransferase family 9 protein [Phenylobacterium sp.]|uniref:glycosyltransferase family 9 protein n=1 Tax=Phenylobacterium sp. TaxID=1871053 RepID=UPI002F3FEC22
MAADQTPEPTPSEALRAQARAALSQRQYAEAEALFAGAVEAEPASWGAWHDRGAVLKMVGKPAESEAALRKALALSPGNPRTRHALGVALLSQGQYVEGWPLIDARHEVPQLQLPKATLPYPEWRGGEPAFTKLLIYPEQGFGDVIQYARLAPWLKARGVDVTLFTHPLLTRLMADSLGVRVIEAAGNVEFPVPDHWVMSGSLVGRCGLSLEAIPSAPYLSPPASAPKMGGGVGVVTRGRPEHPNDANRSLPADAAARLLALPGARSLHPDDTGAVDFADTAGFIASLDLVISVDTATAHLAAAMGKPTWILLPAFMNDWRWMEGRADSPWYPTARLFRQPGLDSGWDPVLDEVEAAVAAR